MSTDPTADQQNSARHIKKCQALFSGWAFLLVFIWAASAWAFTFGVDPARVELSVPAGERRGKAVTVNNLQSDKPLHLKVYVQDIIFLPDGTHDFQPPGSTGWSCADWLKLTPTELDIPAGRTADVRISALAPPGAKGGHYAIVFFESQAPYTAQGIGVNFRIGALVEVVVPKTQIYQAKLAGLSFLPPQDIQVEIFNESNLLIRPKGKLKVLNEQKKELSKIEFNPNRLGVLPSTLRKYEAKLDNPLVSGSYVLRAELDYGTKRLLVGERPFVID